MLSKLTGKHKTYSSLDLPGRKSCLLVVSRKLSCLGGNALENIVNEGVHNGHSLLGDTSIGVDLLKNLVDVRGVGFYAPLVSLGAGGCLLGCLSALLGGCLCHDELLLG